MGIIDFKSAVREAMREILASQRDSVLLGQGVTDPTRIFGTTAGLFEEFGPERVIDTPIAEEGTSGIALGLSLNGCFPISVHIRVDFMLLAMNQIVNLIAKYKYMYGGSFECPMLIRAVVGRSWGQGPQHSQSLQSLFGHIPGLTVIMPATAGKAYHSYVSSAKNRNAPVLSIEHRFLYNLDFENQINQKMENPFSARLVQEGRDVTIVATSYMVQEAQKASDWVREQHGVEVEIIDLHNISSVDHDLIYRSVSKTGGLIVADTSWVPYGVCAEVSRGVLERNPSLKHPVINLGLQFTPTPTSHALENRFYPDMEDLVKAIYQVQDSEVLRSRNLVTQEVKKKYQVEFKGPF